MAFQIKGIIPSAIPGTMATTIISLLFISLFSAQTSMAEKKVLYKKVDKHGNVTFTDKPLDGAKEITVETDKNVVAIPKAQNLGKYNKDEDVKEKTFKYKTFAIDQPANDEPVYAGGGNLNVVIGISPKLKAEHSVRLLINGTAVGQSQKVPYFAVPNVAHGTHQISAEIIDDNTQEVIQTSNSSSFHFL